MQVGTPRNQSSAREWSIPQGQAVDHLLPEEVEVVLWPVWRLNVGTKSSHAEVRYCWSGFWLDVVCTSLFDVKGASKCNSEEDDVVAVPR